MEKGEKIKWSMKLEKQSPKVFRTRGLWKSSQDIIPPATTWNRGNAEVVATFSYGNPAGLQHADAARHKNDIRGSILDLFSWYSSYLKPSLLIDVIWLHGSKSEIEKNLKT